MPGWLSIRKRPFPVAGKLHAVPAYRQTELPLARPPPFAVRPDEQGKQLGMAQFAGLGLQLLSKPVAVILIGPHRPPAQELKGVAAPVKPVGVLDQVQDLFLEPGAGYLWWIGVSGNQFVPGLVGGELAADRDARRVVFGRLQQLEAHPPQPPGPGAVRDGLILGRAALQPVPAAAARGGKGVVGRQLPVTNPGTS